MDLERSDQDNPKKESKRSKMEAIPCNTTDLMASAKKCFSSLLEGLTKEDQRWKLLMTGLKNAIGLPAKKERISFCLLFLMMLFEEELESVNVNLEECVNKFLKDLGLDESACSVVSPSRFLGKETMENAFQSKYKAHGGEDAFLDHFRVQKEAYKQNPSKKYPFFSIIQSSGYGKSRLMRHLQANHSSPVGSGNETPHIVYLSFAETGAYPESNVVVSGLELKGRNDVENAFVRLFETALASSSQTAPTSGEQTYHLSKESATSTGSSVDSSSGLAEANVLFVIDEVSQLLKKMADDKIDFFRCFRKAAKRYTVGRPESFFVLLSTYSSVNQLMPGRDFDPSRKLFMGRDEDVLEPMPPFLLHHAIGVRNDHAEILAEGVTSCLSPRKLLVMGRPMWYAFLATSGSNTEALVEFALAKLLQQDPIPSHTELTPEQVLALLACRACLTISPVSRFAPAMVASHMATAVKIADERDEVVMSYPSEPILALASRSYVRKQNSGAFLRLLILRLKEYFASGAVDKGHRGEAIVRLLNLLAMDRCMRQVPDDQVGETSLGVFLAMFNREQASLSQHLQPTDRRVALSESQIKMLKREGMLDSAKHPAQLDRLFPFELFETGKVCFTHFIHLSDQAKISPNLLRYAYRRTAAIVVNAGRRGIDWIIPVRVGEDCFVGLAGQDKNRMRDTLSALSAISNDATHHKVTAGYFLDPQERQLFEAEGWSLQWPAILFSIGVEEPGAALAEQATRMRHCGNNDGDNETFCFPCIVLTGLGYTELMDGGSDSVLKDLRDFVVPVPDDYRTKVPLTFGVPESRAVMDLGD